jgi:hypothetical protein
MLRGNLDIQILAARYGEYRYTFPDGFRSVCIFSGFITVYWVYNHFSNSVCIPMVLWFRARTSSNKVIERLVENEQSNFPHVRENVRH